jgi:sulfite reductase alpha subunit-like flavoprotein
LSLGSAYAHQQQVFGLGNKTYELFNATARFVDGSLAKLGAHRLHEHGEGDDATQYVSVS